MPAPIQQPLETVLLVEELIKVVIRLQVSVSKMLVLVRLGEAWELPGVLARLLM